MTIVVLFLHPPKPSYNNILIIVFNATALAKKLIAFIDASETKAAFKDIFLNTGFIFLLFTKVIGLRLIIMDHFNCREDEDSFGIP